MVRIVCLTALSLAFLAGAARTGEEELLPLREGVFAVAPFPTNQFTASAAHPRETAETHPSMPSESLVLGARPGEEQFFSWKNACPMDRAKRGGFAGLRPYVAKKKAGDAGFLGYFLAGETP